MRREARPKLGEHAALTTRERVLTFVDWGQHRRFQTRALPVAPSCPDATPSQLAVGGPNGGQGSGSLPNPTIFVSRIARHLPCVIRFLRMARASP